MEVPNEEQIEAYIKGRMYELVQKYCHKESITGDDYEEAFTISRDWAKEYLLSKYRVCDIMSCTDGLKDGLYAIKKLDFWVMYRQERGVHFDEVQLHSESAVWDAYIEFGLGIRE